MAYQRVTPIYDNEAIKSVALQIIDEIKVEAPEILNSLVTITLLQIRDQVGIYDYGELSESMSFYKNISRGVIYNATIYSNNENKISTIPLEGYNYSQEIYYLIASGATVPNPYQFSCVWLNIIPENCFLGNYATQIPGIRYYQQIYNTSANKNILLNNESVVINDNEAFLYDPSKSIYIPTIESNTINIGLVGDNLERTLENCINANPWQVIN